MQVNIPALIEYLDLLSKLEDGDEIVVNGYTIKREGNKIWQHIFDYDDEDEDEIDEAIIEGLLLKLLTSDLLAPLQMLFALQYSNQLSSLVGLKILSGLTQLAH
jgi:hypothetical protein